MYSKPTLLVSKILAFVLVSFGSLSKSTAAPLLPFLFNLKNWTCDEVPALLFKYACLVAKLKILASGFV